MATQDPADSSKKPLTSSTASKAISCSGTNEDFLTAYPLLKDFDPSAPPFYRALHVQYIVGLPAQLETSLEGAMSSHLKMSGVYWTLTALSMLKSTEEVCELMNATELLNWLFSCYDETSGGFGGNTFHDPHILYTLSAIQILAVLDALDDTRFKKEVVVTYIASLQLESGAFVGDQSTTIQEIDSRFSYCALSALSLLDRLNAVNVERAAMFIHSCSNSMDGGYGCTPGAESHAGQVFCCIAALAICKRLDLVQVQLLSWWLAERQCDSGGLNGRPEKQADVCYSWWILSSLSILGGMRYISANHLARFILLCQDDEDGGIADRPDDMVDIFHTFFGIAGLSLTGHLHSIIQQPQQEEGSVSIQIEPVRTIDPVYALPTDIVRRLGVDAQVIVARLEVDDESEFDDLPVHNGEYWPLDERLRHYTILYQD